jgi:hypothetical protein
MSTSSSIPAISDVLFYTPDDPYGYEVDNRPLFNLDTNIRHINSSLVGIGYGEHVSVAGNLLSPGRAVELLTNGAIRYPNADTAVSSRPVLGIVIGSTEAGLNRVIWASEHLDLDSVGLSAIIPQTDSDYFLVANCVDDVTIAGTIMPVLSPSNSQVVIGKVKKYPYVTISSYSSLSNSTVVVSETARANSHNLYGFSRLRNLLAFVDQGQAPIQYTKSTFYIQDLSNSINPMSAKLSADLSNIIKDTTVITTYDSALNTKVLKERYVRFQNATITPDKVANSSWSDIAYKQTLGNNNAIYENYELSPIVLGNNISTPDYSLNAASLSSFKNFTIEKYYQYLKVPPTNSLLYGKLGVTATVFNPGNTNDGGEPNTIIVWDFYEYGSTTGLEVKKHRIVSTGASASVLFSTNSGLFTTELINLM